MKWCSVLALSFLFLLDCPGATVAPLWAARYNGYGSDQFLPAIVDAAGNSYIAGTSFASDSTFSILKRDSFGRRAWLKLLPQDGVPEGMAIDPAGNVYVIGELYKMDHPTDYIDLVLWKFNRAGELEWRVVYDAPDHTLDYANGIGRDDAGGIYVVGRSYTSQLPGAYHTLLKYDAQGNQLWVRRYDGTTNDIAYNTGTLAINPHGGVAAVTRHSAVSYSAAGDLLWSWKGGASFETGFDSVDYRVAGFDVSNHLYIVGSTIVDGEQRAAVNKFSELGTVLWTSVYRNSVEGPAEALDLEIDAAGAAYVALNAPISCARRVDDGEVDWSCQYRPLVAKFSSAGELLWSSRFAVPDDTYPDVSGLALDGSGHAYLTARVFRFNSETLRTFVHEAFLAKCDSDGNQIWSGVYRRPGTVDFWSTQPQVDSRDNLYLTAELIDRTISGGEIDSLVAKFHPLQLRWAPRILAAPKAQTAPLGSNVVFSVRASGAGRLTYQWRLNSRPLAGATSAALKLTNLQPTNAGDYSVEVRGVAGRVVTPEARLTLTATGP